MKFKIVALMMAVVFTLGGCGATAPTNNTVSTESTFTVSPDIKSSEEYKKVSDAVTKAMESDNFVVTTMVNSPSDASTYIEVYDNGKSYTRIPDGTTNYTGTSWQTRVDGNAYILSDYIDKDGNMYLAETADGVSYEMYSVPKSYSDSSKSRKVMFLDVLLNGVKDISFTETITADLGSGDIELDIYSLTVDSTAVKELHKTGSYNMYDSIRKEYPDEIGVTKLMTWYLEDIERTLHFSDGDLIIALDKEGMPRYMSMQMGGLGTFATISKSIVDITDDAKINEPDLSQAVEYKTMLQSYADFAKDFDTIEEMFDAMNSIEVPSEEVTTESVEESSTSSEEVQSEESTSEEVITDEEVATESTEESNTGSEEVHDEHDGHNH